MPFLAPLDIKPAFMLGNGDWNTIYGGLFRKPKFEFTQRITLELPDSDFIDIDTCVQGNTKAAVLVHGLEGSAQASYLKHKAMVMAKKGFDVYALNMRGCSGRPNRLYSSYHSGKTEDVKLLLQHIKSIKNYEFTLLAGFSLGGNVCLKLSGDEGENMEALADAVMTYCVPCHLQSSSARLAKPRNYIYMKRFMIRLHEKMRLKSSLFPVDSDVRAKALKARNFLEFDNMYTAPAHGFKDAEEYWEKCSCLYVIPKIKIPAMLVSPTDDPFLSEKCYPYTEAEKSENFYLDTPNFGGHCGLISAYGESPRDYMAESTDRFLGMIGNLQMR